MNTKQYIKQVYTFLLLGLAAPLVLADNVIIVNLKSHIFEPSVITVPENTKVKLIIVNHDNSPEEFDSFDLNREKVIFANSKAVLFIGPLPKGTYRFFGEYHPDSAIGSVVVGDCKSLLDSASQRIIQC